MSCLPHAKFIREKSDVNLWLNFTQYMLNLNLKKPQVWYARTYIVAIYSIYFDKCIPGHIANTAI
jgi:hypothetical protein